MHLCILFAVFLMQLANCARILVVLPSPILSRNKIYRTIYKELSLKGHDVVVFTPDPMREKISNLKEIDMSYIYRTINLANDLEFYTGIGANYQDINLKTAREVLTHPEIRRMVKHNEHFDLFLVEWSVNPSLGILSKIFNCPMIGMRAIGLTLDGHDYIGNPTNPAYIPNGLTDFDGSFFSRTSNFLFGIMWRINYHFYTIPQSQKLVDELFPDDADDVLEIQKNASLILTNTHPVFTGVRPIVPANIEIGGIHLGREVGILPEDILSFLDSARDGAVYVNLGSHNTKIPNLTPIIIEIISSALSELPYKIIWRWDEADSTVSVNTAFISKWLPQEAILGHPNVKAFITNGGLQSFLEAVHNQVPLVGIPLFADQHMNVRKMEVLRIGKRLDFNVLTKKSLVKAIKSVAESPTYRINIKKASVILHDLPIKPLEKAVWWIEYALRHKGARHLRSAAIDMNWITYLLLDVFAFIALCFAMAFIAMYYLIVWIRTSIRSLLYKNSKAKVE